MKVTSSKTVKLCRTTGAKACCSSMLNVMNNELSTNSTTEYQHFFERYQVSCYVMLFKQPIPSYPVTQRHWKRCRTSLCSSWKVFGMSHMKQFSNSFVYSRLPTGGSVATSYPCSILPMVFWNSPLSPTSRFLPAMFHQQRCCTRRSQFAFTIRAVPFLNKLPAEIVNASSVKSFKALLDAPAPRSTHLTHNPFPQHTSTYVKKTHI